MSEKRQAGSDAYHRLPAGQHLHGRDRFPRVRAQGHPKRGQRQFGHDKHAARDG